MRVDGRKMSPEPTYILVFRMLEAFAACDSQQAATPRSPYVPGKAMRLPLLAVPERPLAKALRQRRERVRESGYQDTYFENDELASAEITSYRSVLKKRHISINSYRLTRM